MPEVQDVRIDKIFTFLLNHRESFCLMLSPMKKYAGENVLNDCMNNFGGFDHNLQTLRIIMNI